MNEASLKYWEEFWGNAKKPSSVSAWQFGDDPDGLAGRVITGKKIATCSCKILYDLEKEPLPKVDDYSVILNSKDLPVAIIRTSEVRIVPMNEVTEDFAIWLKKAFLFQIIFCSFASDSNSCTTTSGVRHSREKYKKKPLSVWFAQRLFSKDKKV